MAQGIYHILFEQFLHNQFFVFRGEYTKKAKAAAKIIGLFHASDPKRIPIRPTNEIRTGLTPHSDTRDAPGR